MRKKSLFAAMLLTASVALDGNASENLLVNGGFEPPVKGPDYFAAFNVPAGSPLITNWNVVQGNVDLTRAASYGPGVNTLHPNSVQDIDLVGDGAFGGLSQSFATVAGQIYRLTFDYSRNNGTESLNGYAAQVIVAEANFPANTVLSTEVSQAYNKIGWLAFSQTFTANSDLTLLQLTSTRGASNAGIYLDEVSVDPVSAVPEISTCAMMLLGFASVGYITYRKRHSAPVVNIA